MIHRLRRLINRQIARATGRSDLLRNGRKAIRDLFAAAHEAHVAPFLMWGTLLGCVRDGGFIAHDRDIDLGLRAADYTRKDAFIAAMLRRGYRLGFDRPYKFRFTHPVYRFHVDVDVFFPWRGGVICATSGEDGEVCGETFGPDAFDRLREIDSFGGLRVAIPDPPEPVLDAIYGDWRVVRADYRSHEGPLNRLVLPEGAPLPTMPTG